MIESEKQRSHIKEEIPVYRFFRAVQRLIILVPNEDKDTDAVSENIEESVLDDSSDIETSKRAQKMKVGKVNTADIIKKYVENDAPFHENTRM